MKDKYFRNITKGKKIKIWNQKRLKEENYTKSQRISCRVKRQRLPVKTNISIQKHKAILLITW